jgi:hypothetical protein
MRSVTQKLALQKAHGTLHWLKKLAGRTIKMHDALIALAFVAMVACPAIVAAFPQREKKDEA